jgi:cell wall assembly regulator SMI1
MTTSVTRLLQRFDAWARTHDLDYLRYRPEGCSEQELASLEARLGFLLPAGLREFLSLMNGEDPGDKYIFGGMNALLSLGEIVAEYDYMMARMGDPLPPEAVFEGPVRRAFWNKKWVPFLMANDLPYYLDLAPEAGGVVGQVIFVDVEGARVCCVATSFEELLAETVEMVLTTGHSHDYAPRWKERSPA